jgi:hypothetical protein
MNLTPAYIRAAINDGVIVRGVLVKLEAETLASNGRNLHRVHTDCFVTFLKAIGWKRLPRRRPATRCPL